MDFIKDNIAVILPLLVFLIGWLLPAPRFFELGQKTGEKIPESLAKLIAERLEAFRNGLIEQDWRGDKTLISNTQFSKATDKLKIDLGLDGLEIKKKD